jgi:hypothetical protein
LIAGSSTTHPGGLTYIARNRAKVRRGMINAPAELARSGEMKPIAITARRCMRRPNRFSSCCFNVAIVKPVVGTVSFPLTVQAALALTKSQPIADFPMLYEVIGIFVLVFCAAIFVAHAIDAFRFRRPSTFKYSSGAPVPRNTTGKQKP